MTFIQPALALAILGILYRRMLKREIPGPIGTKQAILPVLLGAVSPVISTIFTVRVGELLALLGLSTQSIAVPALRAMASAFLRAGLTEELAKFLFMLLCFKLFCPKNLYEYILIGTAVGIGFTVDEEFLYAGSPAGLGRLLTVALHVAFGIVMTEHFGMARYYRQSGGGSAGREYVMAFLIPMLLHTVYDACTTNNPALETIGEELDLAGGLAILVGLAAVLAGTVWQIVVLVQLKKNAEEYCEIKMAEFQDDTGSPDISAK